VTRKPAAVNDVRATNTISAAKRYSGLARVEVVNDPPLSALSALSAKHRVASR
jgi:hypothetical protein